MLYKIISNKLESWKEAAALSRVSLPHLVDFDWAVHIQKASSEVHIFCVSLLVVVVLLPLLKQCMIPSSQSAQVSSMQRPNVLVALNVEDQPSSTLSMPATRTVEFEVSREALETVIDGLGKIRDQLSKMG